MYDTSDGGKSKAVAAFHAQRRMFAVVGGGLVLGDAGTIESHLDWFVRAGWVTGEDDPRYAVIVRGYVDAQRVHFYRGKEFEVTAEVEAVFFAVLPELVARLALMASLPVCGGAVPQIDTVCWPVRRAYGCVGDLLP